MSYISAKIYFPSPLCRKHPYIPSMILKSSTVFGQCSFPPPQSNLPDVLIFVKSKSYWYKSFKPCSCHENLTLPKQTFTHFFLYWTDSHLTPVTCGMFGCYWNRPEQHFPSQFMGLISIFPWRKYIVIMHTCVHTYIMGVLTLMACTSFRRCSWYERSRFLIVSWSSSISVPDWESGARSRIYSRC